VCVTLCAWGVRGAPHTALRCQDGQITRSWLMGRGGRAGGRAGGGANAGAWESVFP
jgi:hypothetical protein